MHESEKQHLLVSPTVPTKRRVAPFQHATHLGVRALVVAGLAFGVLTTILMGLHYTAASDPISVKQPAGSVAPIAVLSSEQPGYFGEVSGLPPPVRTQLSADSAVDAQQSRSNISDLANGSDTGAPAAQPPIPDPLEALETAFSLLSNQTLVLSEALRVAEEVTGILDQLKLSSCLSSCLSSSAAVRSRLRPEVGFI